MSDVREPSLRGRRRCSASVGLRSGDRAPGFEGFRRTQRERAPRSARRTPARAGEGARLGRGSLVQTLPRPCTAPGSRVESRRRPHEPSRRLARQGRRGWIMGRRSPLRGSFARFGGTTFSSHATRSSVRGRGRSYEDAVPRMRGRRRVLAVVRPPERRRLSRFFRASSLLGGTGPHCCTTSCLYRGTRPPLIDTTSR